MAILALILAGAAFFMAAMACEQRRAGSLSSAQEARIRELVRSEMAIQRRLQLGGKA